MVSQIKFRWSVSLLHRRKGDNFQYGKLPKGYQVAHALEVIKHKDVLFLHKLWSKAPRRRTNVSRSYFHKVSLQTTVELRLKRDGELVKKFFTWTKSGAEVIGKLWASNDRRSYKIVDHISDYIKTAPEYKRK